MLEKTKTIEWVQALRGIAALLVVLTHARYFMHDTPQWQLAQELLLPGAMGVDLFFILSGFIIVLSTATTDGTMAYALQFAAKRIARIWPAYAVVTLIYVISFHGLTYLQDHSGLIAVAKSLFFIPADYSQYFFFGVALPVGWSLEYEMYFYVVFGVCLLFGKYRFAALIAWSFVSVFAIPYLAGVYTLDVLKPRIFSVDYLQLATNPMLLEFTAGALIGLLHLAKPLTIRSQKIALNLLALSVAFPVWVVCSGMTYLHGPTQWGWPLAVMVLGMSIASHSIEIPTPRVLVWLGEISFSLYLTHLLAQFYANYLLTSLGLSAYIHTWSHIFFSTLFAIALASIAHHYLEKKLSEIVRAWLLSVFAQRNKMTTTNGTSTSNVTL